MQLDTLHSKQYCELNLRANGLASARITLGLASLLALSSIAIVFCANVISDSAKAIHELTETKENREQAELVEIAQLFDEHENFVGLVGRRGYISRHSLAFMQRCRRELELFCGKVGYREFAPEIVAEALLRLAQLESMAGNPIAAKQQLQACIELANSAQALRLLGYAHNATGVLESSYGKYTEALTHFQYAANFLQQVPEEKEMLAQALRNQAIATAASGRIDLVPALTSIEVSATNGISSELEPLAEINIDCQVALAHHLQESGRAGDALECLHSAEKDLDQLVAVCQQGVVDGEIASARKYLNAIERVEFWIATLEAAEKKKNKSNGQTRCWPWLFNIPGHTLDLALRPEIKMCAEFESQSALMVAWSSYENINQVVSEIILNTWEKLQLVVVVNSEDSYYEVVDFLIANDIPRESIRFSFVDIDSCWLRDLGPIAANDESGNSAWFDAQIVRKWRRQNVVADGLPSILSNTWNTSRNQSSLFIEGGAILSNGDGLTVCSNSIPLINKRYGFTASAVVNEIERITGANNLCFVEPLKEEPTGHIDMFMTFVSPTEVVMGEFVDKQNPNAAILDSNARKLSSLQVDGHPLKVHRVPIPESSIPWANYTNVVYANGVLLVPSWNGASTKLESKVRTIYQQLLPDWKIVSIDCSELVNAGGALHCLTCNLGTAVPIQRTLSSPTLATGLSMRSP